MRVPGTRALLRALRRRVADKRPPDMVIGGQEDPYLRRWYVVPRNRFFNLYLHHFLRSDDDRALHDHPWWNVSLLLRGEYLEHVPRDCHLREEGYLYFRPALAAHRVELFARRAYDADDQPIWKETPVWTLFITGPRVREWGFHCPKGWRHWKDFCGVTADGRNAGTIGKGCD